MKKKFRRNYFWEGKEEARKKEPRGDESGRGKEVEPAKMSAYL